jgi:hypothetical protein
MEPLQYNTHSRSPGWVPLKNLFRANAAEFLQLHAAQRFTEKYMIGVTMWDWMCRTGRVDRELKRLAEEIHYRPTKEKTGLPLWRLAFKDTLRNTPEVDALFVGKRLGPTPRYARLVQDGVVPADPRDFVQESAEPEVSTVALPQTRRYDCAAREEWIVRDGGQEWLYVYTMKRELDNFESRGVRPLLKIGQTRQHYTARIASQIGSTSAHSRTVCLLAYQVRDAQQLEAAVHKALKVQDLHVKDAPGIEWFEVTPEEAHQLIAAIAGNVRRLSGS